MKKKDEKLKRLYRVLFSQSSPAAFGFILAFYTAATNQGRNYDVQFILSNPISSDWVKNSFVAAAFKAVIQSQCI